MLKYNRLYMCDLEPFSEIRSHNTKSAILMQLGKLFEIEAVLISYVYS